VPGAQEHRRAGSDDREREAPAAAAERDRECRADAAEQRDPGAAQQGQGSQWEDAGAAV